MATLSHGRGWASDACAASIHRLDGQTGRILPIASAGRTYAQQAEAYRLYKAGKGPLALPPGTSIHEQGNAVDWGNAVYSFLGLYAGTGERGLTINRNGHKRTVQSEVWHTEYNPANDQFRGSSSGGGKHGLSTQEIINIQNWLNSRGWSLTVDGDYGPATTAAVKEYQRQLNAAGFSAGTEDGIWGAQTQAATFAFADSLKNNWPANKLYGAAWVQSIQNKLNRLGYNVGAEDGQDGPATQAAVKSFQEKYGLTVDGVAGPLVNNKLDALLSPTPVGRNATTRPTVEIQKYLASKGYSLGQYGADGDYGVATTAAVIAFQKANGLEPDGVWGPLADAKAFPATPPVTPPVTPPATKYPTDGRNATTRPTKDIQKLVGTDQDGVYGPNTSTKVAQWQEKQGLSPVDGIWGPASDAKGFPGVPLPDAPADPTTDPLYGKKTPQYPGAIWADVSPNKSVREGEVKLFIIHHIGSANSTIAGDRSRFMKANDRNVSPNYLVQRDGGVSEIVPPDDYRAWTTGAVDHQAVTVETQNIAGEPAWLIADVSKEAIAQLIAWAAHRYGFPVQRGSVVLDAAGKNVVTIPGVVGHRDTPAGKSTSTICPGPDMGVDVIIMRAAAIFKEKYETPEVPTDPETPGMTLVPTEFLVNLKANQLADAEEISKYLN